MIDRASCIVPETVAALVDLRLSPDDEREVRAHLGACRACLEEVVSREPAWVFATLPRVTLPGGAWQDVMRAVRAEVAAHPRGTAAPSGGWVERFLLPLRLSPAPVVAVLAMLALTIALFRSAPGPALEVAAVPADTGEQGSGFVYLSNPRAQVTHVLVAGDEGPSPVQVTMVVDETLDDAF